MNRKQRLRNRSTATKLADHLKEQRRLAAVCPRCGTKGEYHWVTTHPQTLQDLIEEHAAGCAKPESHYGFWVCSDLYDPETGRRKPEHIVHSLANPGAAALSLLMELMTPAGVEDLPTQVNRSL